MNVHQFSSECIKINMYKLTKCRLRRGVYDDVVLVSRIITNKYTTLFNPNTCPSTSHHCKVYTHQLLHTKLHEATKKISTLIYRLNHVDCFSTSGKYFATSYCLVYTHNTDQLMNPFI